MNWDLWRSLHHMADSLLDLSLLFNFHGACVSGRKFFGPVHLWSGICKFKPLKNLKTYRYFC